MVIVIKHGAMARRLIGSFFKKFATDKDPMIDAPLFRHAETADMVMSFLKEVAGRVWPLAKLVMIIIPTGMLAPLAS